MYRRTQRIPTHMGYIAPYDLTMGQYEWQEDTSTGEEKAGYEYLYYDEDKKPTAPMPPKTSVQPPQKPLVPQAQQAPKKEDGWEYYYPKETKWLIPVGLGIGALAIWYFTRETK